MCIRSLWIRIASNPDRSAVEIAWEAFLTADKIAKKLENLIVLSSSENYVSQSKMGLLHRCVLGLTRLDIKDFLESFPNQAIDEKDADGQTPLYWAARRGDVQTVSLLLEAGADQNSKNNSGGSILTAAIKSGNTECIWKILRSGCDINHAQKDGYTPLHHCCRHNADLSIIRALLDRGANLTAQTSLGHTPLMIATFNKLTPIAQHLITTHLHHHLRPTELNIQGKDGASALHFAAMSGDHQTAQQLLHAGANHLLKTTNDETFLHVLAQRSGDCDSIRALEEFGLKGLSVGDITRKRGLTAMQIAEKEAKAEAHSGGGGGEGEGEWLEMFRGLVGRVAGGEAVGGGGGFGGGRGFGGQERVGGGKGRGEKGCEREKGEKRFLKKFE